MNINLPVKFIGTYKFTLTHDDGSSEEYTTHNTACAAIRNTQFQSSLSLGQGTGTPAFADTSLFSYLWNVAASTVSKVSNVGNNGARVTLTFILPATSSYVGTITEVGLGPNGSLWTHALLADAEGNPISIVKTDTDLLTIDATVELYITSTFPLVHGLSRICKAGQTEVTLAALLLSLISARAAWSSLTGYSNSAYIPWKVMSAVPANLISMGRSYRVGGKYPSTSAVAGFSPNYAGWGDDSTNKRSTFVSNFRYTTDGFNGHYYRYLHFLWGLQDTDYMWEDSWIQSFAMGIDLLNPEIFSAQEFKGVTVATGDGTTTAFACPLSYFQKDTDVLYKNGVALTRGVDYTIEHFANKDRLPELMHLTSSDPDAIKITGSRRSNQVQFAPEQYSGTSNPEVATSFEDSIPLHIDWGEARKCNCIKGYLYRYYTKEIFVDYSTDNVTWHQVATADISTDTNTGAQLDLSWNAVEARYWRIRITRYGTDTSKTSYAYFSSSWDFFGFYDPTGIRFMEAPAEGDLITMDCVSDIPFKNENFVFNLALNITLSYA